MTDKTTKIIIGIAVVLVVVLVILMAFNGSNKSTGAVIGAQSGPIKVGFIGPLTGDAAGIGTNSKEAVELAVSEINKAGGINGRQLEVIYEDGLCNGKSAVSAATKLINIDQVSAIVGGECSSETLGIVPLVESAKVVILSPCSSAPSITSAGDYIFRNYPSDSYQGKESARFAYNELGAKKVASLYCLSDYCTAINDVFQEEYKKLGGTIVANEGYEQTSRDLRAQLTKIKAANPDVIYFIGYTEGVVVGLKQAKELGITAQMLGGDAWDDPNLAKEAGSAAEGSIYGMVASPLTEEFKAAMKEKTGKDDLTICSPQAYDAMNILAEVMKKVGTDSTAIKNALYKVQDYDGVSGVISFDANGDVSEAKYIFKIIRGGKAVEMK
jgi:branched-chain amino acid transport system substrate-binding protein